MKSFRSYLLVQLVAMIVLSNLAISGEILDAIKKRGVIRVGVNQGLFGFAKADERGVWRGIDVDTGHAIAAAVFGDANKVEFIPISELQRFTSLQSGEIDVLCHNTTKRLTRDSELGLNFAHENFYDGQGFMVPKKLGIVNARQLSGATICILQGTTTEMTTADFFRTNTMKWEPVVIEGTSELNKVFFAGRCDCITSDASQLAGIRAAASKPSDYIILPERITKEPLAPAVRHGDDQWFDIVNYSILAMINAEELGVDSKNVDEMLKTESPEIKRFLGVIPGNGKALGLDEKFTYNIIKQVGNYGEVFERNVGINTPLGLERGLNALWKDCGLMYSPPFN